MTKSPDCEQAAHQSLSLIKDTTLQLPATESNQDILPEPIDREELYIRNLFLCDSALEAATKAGYSYGYATGPLYKRLKSHKFQEKLRKYAITHELLNIPKVMRLESAAIDYLEGKPAELPKFAAILKQKKQIAGLLHQEQVAQVPTISIDQVQNLMLNVSQVSPKVDDNSSNRDK